MNPVVMTIINPLKAYWPPAFKSCMLPNEIWGSESRQLFSLKHKYPHKPKRNAKVFE